jgi:hypothetical protein
MSFTTEESSMSDERVGYVGHFQKVSLIAKPLYVNLPPETVKIFGPSPLLEIAKKMLEDWWAKYDHEMMADYVVDESKDDGLAEEPLIVLAQGR